MFKPLKMLGWIQLQSWLEIQVVFIFILFWFFFSLSDSCGNKRLYMRLSSGYFLRTWSLVKINVHFSNLSFLKNPWLVIFRDIYWVISNSPIFCRHFWIYYCNFIFRHKWRVPSWKTTFERFMFKFKGEFTFTNCL